MTAVLDTPRATREQVLALAGDDYADGVFIELAGKWKHGWVPLDAIAEAIKAKRLHSDGSGKWVHDPSKPFSHGKSRINVGEQMRHAAAGSGKVRPPKAKEIGPRDAVRMKRAELEPHAARGSKVAKAELERRAAKRSAGTAKVAEAAQERSRAIQNRHVAEDEAALRARSVKALDRSAKMTTVHTAADHRSLAAEHRSIAKEARSKNAESFAANHDKVAAAHESIASRLDHGRAKSSVHDPNIGQTYGDLKRQHAYAMEHGQADHVTRTKAALEQRGYTLGSNGKWGKARDEAIKAKHPAGSDVAVHEPGARRGDKPVEYSGKVVGSKAGHVAVMPNEGHGVDSKHARAVNPEHVTPASPGKVTLTGNESYNLTTGERIPSSGPSGASVIRSSSGAKIAETHHVDISDSARKPIGKQTDAELRANYPEQFDRRNPQVRAHETMADRRSAASGRAQVISGEVHLGNGKTGSEFSKDHVGTVSKYPSGGWRAQHKDDEKPHAGGPFKTKREAVGALVMQHESRTGASLTPAQLGARYGSMSTHGLQDELKRPGLAAAVRQVIEAILGKRKARP